jgi:hypothetical protein
MAAKRVYFDTLRSLDYTGISGTYAAIGTALAFNPRALCITNNTNGDLIFSDDNTISPGKVFIPAFSYRLYDLLANFNSNIDDSFVLAIGTTIYVKQSTSPTSGAVYLEYVYGNT